MRDALDAVTPAANVIRNPAGQLREMIEKQMKGRELRHSTYLSLVQKPDATPKRMTLAETFAHHPNRQVRGMIKNQMKAQDVQRSARPSLVQKQFAYPHLAVAESRFDEWERKRRERLTWLVPTQPRLERSLAQSMKPYLSPNVKSSPSILERAQDLVERPQIIPVVHKIETVAMSTLDIFGVAAGLYQDVAIALDGLCEYSASAFRAMWANLATPFDTVSTVAHNLVETLDRLLRAQVDKQLVKAWAQSRHDSDEFLHTDRKTGVLCPTKHAEILYMLETSPRFAGRFSSQRAKSLASELAQIRNDLQNPKHTGIMPIGNLKIRVNDFSAKLAIVLMS